MHRMSLPTASVVGRAYALRKRGFTVQTLLERCREEGLHATLVLLPDGALQLGVHATTPGPMRRGGPAWMLRPAGSMRGLRDGPIDQLDRTACLLAAELGLA